MPLWGSHDSRSQGDQFGVTVKCLSLLDPRTKHIKYYEHCREYISKYRKVTFGVQTYRLT